MEPWLRSFFTGTLLSGILWCAGGVLLAGEDLTHQFCCGLLLAGLAAGGVSTLSSYRGAYAAFLLPSMVPFAARMALYLDTVHVSMGSMILLFVALMLGISARIHATIAESLRLRFRNLGLVDTLSATKGNLEKANTALQHEIGEHRKAQEILMKSEQKLRLHAHQAPLAFIEWDLSFSPLAFGHLSGKYLNGARPEGARLTRYPPFGQRYDKPNVMPAVAAYADLAGRAGLTAAALAIAFVRSRWFCASTIIGATTLAQLGENIDTGNLNLDAAILADIDAVHLRYPNPAV